MLLGAQKWGAPALSAAVVVYQPGHLLMGAQKWGAPALSAAVVSDIFELVVSNWWWFKNGESTLQSKHRRKLLSFQRNKRLWGFRSTWWVEIFCFSD
jgi:hypothetical protein